MVGLVDVGESSRVVRLLTPDHGRIAAMARGARASRRKWAGLLEPGARLRVQIKAGRGDLSTLVDAEAVSLPRRPRGDLRALCLLAYGCELCAALAPENHEAERLHGLLTAWLERLEVATPTVGARIALEAKALTFAGLAPALIRCARCGRPAEPEMRFHAEAGGAVHPRCGSGVEIAFEALVAVEVARRTPLAEVADLPGVPPWLLGDFAAWHVGHPLRSRAMVEESEAMGASPG